MDMTPAGTTATTAQSHSPADPFQQAGPTFDSPAPTAGGELFAAFRAEATKRREQHSRQDAGRPADWADPDPTALALLLPRRHPVARVIARQKEGKPRRGFEYKLIANCARLQGVARHSVTLEDVHAYPWHQLDADAAEDFRRDVYRQYSLQSTRNDLISVVRRVTTECHRVGLISALRKDEVLEQLYTIAPSPSTRRRRLTATDIELLLATAANQTNPIASARDVAIIALLRTSGMRSIEVARLTLADWDVEEGTILLRETKNRRDHLVQLHPATVDYLHRWIQVRGRAPGALFTPVRGRSLRHLSEETVQNRVQFLGHAAGIAHFGSHDFRRTFATELLRTHDAPLVGKLLNHKKLTSTMVYDLASEDEQRTAVASIKLPKITPHRHHDSAGGSAA